MPGRNDPMPAQTLVSHHEECRRTKSQKPCSSRNTKQFESRFEYLRRSVIERLRLDGVISEEAKLSLNVIYER